MAMSTLFHFNICIGGLDNIQVLLRTAVSPRAIGPDRPPTATKLKTSADFSHDNWN